MKVAVDASNIRSGGGLTHLRCLLGEAEPAAHGIDRVVVWGARGTLGRLADRPWLEKVAEPALERSLPWRLAWQQFVLPRVLASRGCDVLFSPGGTLPRDAGVPTVAISQNLLPFEPAEAARFGLGRPMWIKCRLLRYSQGRSFRGADGVIFLSEYARDRIVGELGPLPGRQTIVAHGIEDRFRAAPRPQSEAASFSDARPFRFLYVSTVDAYKHQAVVAAAVGELRRHGLPVAVDFVGEGRAREAAALRGAIAGLDRAGRHIRWLGAVPYDALHETYRNADAFVFASTCENLPNILLEAMAAGLPIASSRRGPMPEVLCDAGLYFDPESAAETAEALRGLFADAKLRGELAARAHRKARDYSWKRCADMTCAFIAEAGRRA